MPLFVPVSLDRLLSDKNSDFFTHLENLKKLRKHHPRLVTIVEVDLYLGFAFSHDKIEFGTWITQPVIIGVFLRVIPIFHDEKADSEWDKDTPEKGIKRRVFIISIDQS